MHIKCKSGYTANKIIYLTSLLINIVKDIENLPKWIQWLRKNL